MKFHIVFLYSRSNICVYNNGSLDVRANMLYLWGGMFIYMSTCANNNYVSILEKYYLQKSVHTI